jgi:predicted transcriptional regulator/DNA-binding XRE family transcriptional regulator
MEKKNAKIVKVERVGDSNAGRVVGGSLKALRELAGLTKSQMAARLQIGQAAVSKIEHLGDVQISTLEKYVRALGAKLRIEASFPLDREIVKTIRDAFDAEITDENQLVFPIFDDEVFRPQRDVVLSIRPQYSDKIIRGEKTVELRRRFPISAPRGTIAYLYSTSPVQAMVGWAEIAGVVKASVSTIWRNYAKPAAIKRTDFDAYFGKLKEGYALKLSNVHPFARKMTLSELRERFGFKPPQSFLYATPTLRSALKNEHSDLPY